MVDLLELTSPIRRMISSHRNGRIVLNGNMGKISKKIITVLYKKAELTPGLARDRTATWRLTVNLASLTAILTV